MQSRRPRGRPREPSHLVARRPGTALGWTMRALREAHGWTAKRTAEAFGWHPSHITRVEVHGTTPSRELVNFYEQTFEADGLLLSLFEVVIHSAEQDRRRSGVRRAQDVRSIPGDRTAFVEDTIPQGTLMSPGQVFANTWTIRNVGVATWEGRRALRFAGATWRVIAEAIGERTDTVYQRWGRKM